MTLAIPTSDPGSVPRSRANAETDAAWGNVHAVALLTATALGAALHLPALPTGVGISSLAVLVIRSRGRWTPSGGFGVANGVTTLRLLMTLALVCGSGPQLGRFRAAVALSILVLDAVDGWLARRRDAAGPFGTRFDMEVDALFVLSLSGALWSLGAAGAWVLLAGLWRYLFVIVPLIVPSRGGEAPRSIYYRSAYSVMVLSFLAALVSSPELAPLFSAFGTAVVSISFLRSFWYRYRPPASAAPASS